MIKLDVFIVEIVLLATLTQFVSGCSMNWPVNNKIVRLDEVVVTARLPV